MNHWEIPKHRIYELQPRKTKYCLCVPVINEGEKIRKQLERMLPFAQQVDILICDGGSTDGSLDPDFLKLMKVSALLVKKDAGWLGAQLRMGFAYAIIRGYAGIITMDGNGKDNVEAILDFIQALDEGWDMVQGSRYIPGGQAINTPLIRSLAIRLIHAPVVSLVSGFHYTDTTNGYRAHSRQYLMDERVQPFRSIFQRYELLGYLSVRAPQLRFRTKEIPVVRAYPAKGKTPTKLKWMGMVHLLAVLWDLIWHRYDPCVTSDR
jgi:dolichol-phosphate mannosyltransferase